MSQAPSPFASSFVWYELMTTDTAAATRFYADVVGWTPSDAQMPGMEYTLLGAAAGQVGGLMALPAEAAAHGARPGWLGYLAVADVDASVSAIQAAGGALHHGPMDVPGVGRMATVGDPQGAVFCVFKDVSPNPSSAAQGEGAGQVGWNELMAGNGATAWDFYSAHFGWQKADAMDMGPMGVYQMFGTGGAPVGGMMSKPPELPVACWNFYFNVPALDAAVARLKAGGGQVLNGPMEVPGGSWIVNAMDPQGAAFSLVAPVR
jgi:uncharacterized protein